jgi:predicted aspartyl protease
MRTLLCAAAIWVGLAQWASARCTLELVGELTVDTAQARAMTTGQIDGKPVRIMIDTGSAFSFIWADAAQRLGLTLSGPERVRVFGVGGEAKVQETLVRQMQIGTLSANDIRPLVIVGRQGPSGDSASFVLGDDVLSHFDTEFDLPDGKIRLFHAHDCEIDQVPYWAHSFSLADLGGWNPANPHIESEVQVNGRPVTAWLDTGSTTSSVSRLVSSRAGVTPWITHPEPVSHVSGLGAEQVASWVGTFDTFSIGDEKIAHVPLVIADVFRDYRTVETGSHVRQTVDDNLPNMLIGLDFFMAHRILVMQKQRKMVFTYDSGPVFRTKTGDR